MAQAGTVSNTNVYPVWVVFNDVVLGYANEGEATVNIEYGWQPQTAHQTGTHELDFYFTGQTATVDIEMAEIENLDNWVVAFGLGESQIDTATPPARRIAGTKIAATTNSVYVGTKATTIAQQLVLRPVKDWTDATTETTDDLVFQKAFAMNVPEIVHSLNQSQTLNPTFKPLFDPTKTDGSNLWIRGLETGTGAWVAGG